MKTGFLRHASIRAARLGAIVIAVLILLGALASPVLAKRRMVEMEDNPIDQILKRYQRVEMDIAEVAKKVRATGELLLPTENGVFEISLKPHDMRAPRYRAEEAVGNGLLRTVRPEPIRTYRGTVAGIPGAEVRFSIRNDSLEGIILTPDDWYLVEPMRNYDPSSGRSAIVVYKASDVIPEAYGTCAATLAERIEKVEDYLIPQVLDAKIPAAGASLSVADVATEADYEYVTAFGSSASANNTILDIMNQVDGIYRSQLSISLQVVYQHTWATDSDPYTTTKPVDLLDEFKNYWTADLNLKSQTYDLAHMWTGKDMDGSTIGIAWVGVVCNARPYSYGISQRFNAIPGKFILSAHEIGHNFGASHVDNTTLPTDSCKNTIMNPSVGTGTTFCSFSQTEITAHASRYPSCLATVSTGCDVNGDGNLNTIDMQYLVNVIIGFSSCPGNCDTNLDGSVDVLDVQLLSNIILGEATCPQ